jgi:hypothetical protein
MPLGQQLLHVAIGKLSAPASIPATSVRDANPTHMVADEQGELSPPGDTTRSRPG